MLCPKGSETRESTHTVTTFAKAHDWCPGVTTRDLPLKIHTSTASDGRMCAIVTNSKGYVIHKRG